MTKIITALNEKYVQKYLLKNHLDIKYLKAIHPRYAEKIAKKAIESDDDFICFDTVILDYIDLAYIYIVTRDGELKPYYQFFKDNPNLSNLYAGEMILNSIIKENENG